MIFTSEQELYLRDKVELANKLMQDLNGIIARSTLDVQQDLTDSIVDVYNLAEALHYHIDIHLVLSRKIQEARVENAKLNKELHETKLLLNDTNKKLERALEQPL